MLGQQNLSERGQLTIQQNLFKKRGLKSDSSPQHKTVEKVKYHEKKITFLMKELEKYRVKYQNATAQPNRLNFKQYYSNPFNESLPKRSSPQNIDSNQVLTNNFSPNRKVSSQSAIDEASRWPQMENRSYMNNRTSHKPSKCQQEQKANKFDYQTSPELEDYDAVWPVEIISSPVQNQQIKSFSSDVTKISTERLQLSNSKPHTEKLEWLKGSQTGRTCSNSSNYGYQEFQYFISDALKLMSEPTDTTIQKWLQECLQFLQLKGKHSFQLQGILRAKSLSPSIGPTRKTLVFGLDRTLLYCQEGKRFPGDQQVLVKLPSGKLTKAHIKLRPNCQKILVQLSRIAEIVVFSASHRNYVESAIKLFDNQSIISEVLSREHCTYLRNGQITKDLQILGRDLKDIVLIDSYFSSFNQQINNCIPILPYFGQDDDDQMQKLYDFLKEYVLNQHNVQNVISNYFQLSRWSKNQNIEEVFQKTFKSQ